MKMILILADLDFFILFGFGVDGFLPGAASSPEGCRTVQISGRRGFGHQFIAENFF
jgi:hypothetical protein